jgi:hypothetical protein
MSGIIGGLSGANAATSAANQDTAAENNLLGTQTGADQQLISQYFGSNGGASLLGSLGPMLLGQVGSTYTNPYASAASSTASGLANFQGLKPQEVSALQTTLGNSGMSTINTLQGQLGGVANPGAVIGNALGENEQNSLNLGTQLGSIGAQQELGAQTAAGSLQSGLSGQNLSYLGTMIQGLLGATGQESGLLGQGLGGLQSMTGLYAGQAANAASQANADNAGMKGALGGAASGLATGGVAGNSKALGSIF